MAKGKKAATAETVNEEISENGDEGSLPSLNKDQKRGLLMAYKEADDAVTAAEQAVIDAKKARSEACKTVLENMGAGPFMLNKIELGKIVERDGNFFFRGKRERETEAY